MEPTLYQEAGESSGIQTVGYSSSDLTTLLTLVFGSLLITFYEIFITHQASSFYQINFGFFTIITASSSLGLGAMLAAFSKPGHRDLHEGTGWLGPYICGSALACCIAMFIPAIFTLGPWPLLTIFVLSQAGPFILWGFCLGTFFRQKIIADHLLFSTIGGGSAGGVVIGFALLQTLANSTLLLWFLCAVFLAFGLALSRSRAVMILTCLTVILFGLGTSSTKWNTSPIPKWDSLQTQNGSLLSTMIQIQYAGKLKQVAHSGNADSRLDLVGVKEGEGSSRWLFRNGAFHSVMVGQTSQNTVEVLQAAFPLSFLPLQAGQPENFLSINPGGGLELTLAKELGVSAITGLESDSAMKTVWNKSSEFHGNFPESDHISVMYDNPRSFLAREEKLFDLIQITLKNDLPILWPGWGIMQDFNSTSEAFTTYWNHLEPEGLLAISTTNEPACARAFCQIWEILERKNLPDTGNPRRKIWIFKAPQSAAIGNSNNYLLLARKGDPSDDFQERLDIVRKNLSAIPLFGPGLPTAPQFEKFAQGSSALVGRLYLNRILNQQFRTALDLSSTSDLKPFFFHFIIAPNPFLKWGLGFSLLLLTICLLIPLPELRSLDAPRNNDRFPIPVFLGYFILLGAGFFIATAFLVYKATLSVDNPVIAVPLTLGFSFAGLAIGSGLSGKIYSHRRTSRLKAPLMVAIFLLTLTASRFSPVTSALSTGATILSYFITIAAPLLMGMCLGPIFPLGLKHLCREFPDLSNWAFASYAVALTGSAIPLQWLIRFNNWNMAGFVAAGCFISIYFLQFWLWRTDSNE